MRKNICRVLAMVLALTMVLAASACTINIKVSYDDKAIEAIKEAGNNSGAAAPVAAPTAAPETTAPTTAPSTTAPTTAPATPDAPSTETTTASATPATPDTPATPETPATEPPAAPAASTGLPSTNEEILAKYAEVINQAKMTDKPTFYKVEYQELPEDKRNFGGAADKVLGIAQGFMTDKATAEANAKQTEKGDVGGIPVYHNEKSCLLTDASCIKSASCVDNGDGTATIKITLNSEKNPEPAAENATTAPSFHGAMFPPMAKADIDETLAGIPGLSVEYFDLNYTDCTATLTYNTSDNHVTYFDQIMNVEVAAKGKLVILGIEGTAVLVNTMILNNFQY